jgi:hypothetical protein
MAYGHAERALAAIRALEAETDDLLCTLPQLDAEQRGWLEEVMRVGKQVCGETAGIRRESDFANGDL